MVNRIWHHFGRGLCPTPSELGHSGEPPTHPKLLDDLAVRFVKHGWSFKWLHHEILNSATWQQSIDNPAAHKTDPANEHLACMSRRRLDVETWRDAMLHASGQLDLTLGGEPKDLKNKDNFRRTLYSAIHRREPNQFLRIHDFPDPTAHAPTRPQTITPLQQLFSLNGPFIQWQAEAFAANLMKVKGTEARVNAAYEKLFQRAPRKTELGIAVLFFEDHENDQTVWTQYAHALLAGNEFQFWINEWLLNINRRTALTRMGAGMGTLGLFNSLQAATGMAPHFMPQAKRVIHLFMNGGPFRPDFWTKAALKQFEACPAGTDLRTERPTGGCSMPYKYQRYRQSGLEVSELLPHTAKFADDLCVLRSVHTDNPNHGPALLLMNNGTIRPRCRAWARG